MSDGYLKIKVNVVEDAQVNLWYVSRSRTCSENDEILEYYGLKVLVDQMMLLCINGTTIDF